MAMKADVANESELDKESMQFIIDVARPMDSFEIVL